MRLSRIYEGVAGPGTPEERRLTRDAADLAGDSGEAAGQVRKQLEAQQAARDKDPKLKLQQKRQQKNVLSQLSNVEWDPSDSKFQKLAAQALGKPGV